MQVLPQWLFFLPAPNQTAACKPTGYTVAHQFVRQVRQVRHKRHATADCAPPLLSGKQTPPAHQHPRPTPHRQANPRGIQWRPHTPLKNSQKFPKIPKISHASATPPPPARHRCHQKARATYRHINHPRQNTQRSANPRVIPWRPHVVH